MLKNGLSTKDDFRRAAEAEREKRAESVRLPSGLVAKLVKPMPMELFFMQGSLPQGIAARLPEISDFKSEISAAIAPEDLVALARQTVELVRFIFLSPGVPGECQPGRDILMSDVEWALRWARGEVVTIETGDLRLEASQASSPKPQASSYDLAAFPERAPRPTATPGASGGDVVVPPV